MIRNIHGGNILLVSLFFFFYLNSKIDFSSIYGWVNSDSDKRCVLQSSTQLQRKKIFLKEGNDLVIIMAVHQNSVSSVCQKVQRMFYAPFTSGREHVSIFFGPTNILKIRTFS